MTAGRPPKPQKTKNPGKPKPPEQLKGRSLEEWKRVVPELMKRGLLEKVDAAQLAFYCKTYARWQEAEDVVNEEGMLIQTQSGNVIQHPAVGIANTAIKLAHRLASDFGFSPASRRRMPPEEEEVEELDLS